MKFKKGSFKIKTTIKPNFQDLPVFPVKTRNGKGVSLPLGIKDNLSMYKIPQIGECV